MFARIVVATVVAFTALSASALPFYAVDNPNRDLYYFDTNSLGTPTKIGKVTTSAVDLAELIAASPTTLYTFERSGNKLLTISVSNAAILSSVSLDIDVAAHPRGFDLAPDGTLYGIFGDVTSSSSNRIELRTINSVTGATTRVTGVTGAAGVEAIAFGRDGSLFAVGDPADPYYSHALYRLNLLTGALALVGSLAVPDVDTLTFGIDGFLYGADSLDGWAADLYRIDPATAHVTVVGNTGVGGLNGLAQVGGVVGEPTTLALLGLGLAGLLQRRQRRCLN